jgi:hypothetical protein
VAILRLIVFAATCVFAKQSLGPILCGPLQLSTAWMDHLPEAPLLPKLRGHFAEFLLHGSLEHLRLLASPTCVGFRYGRTKYSYARLFLAASVGNPWQCKHCARRPVSPIDRSFRPRPGYPVASGHPSPDDSSASASPLVINTLRSVRESLPVSHRLRLSASA